MGRRLRRLLKEDRGQVGVGSLIIFISIILVAAISAGVLLRSSGVLSVRATSTAEQATKEVSTKLEVFQVTGYTSEASGSRENITKVLISARLAPGSPPIAVDELMLIYQAGDTYISGITKDSTTKNFTVDFTRNTTADNTLEEGETVDLIYDQGGTMKVGKGTALFFTIQPRQGVISIVKKTVPNALPYAYIQEWG